MARLSEGLVVGAIKDYATANIDGVTFYLPELEPSIAASTSWAMLDVEFFNDNPTHAGEWNGHGRARAFISSRKSGGNIYAAKTIANSLSSLFANSTVTVDEASVTKGYIRFGVARSRMLGEADGIINHFFEIDFFVQEA